MPKILVVDDEVNISELIQFNLERDGYEVIVAYDGFAACKEIENQHFDLVILDIMLPGMDGLTVCKEIRKSDLALPVIMLSAKSELFDRILGLELGADDYVTKPFAPRELLARVKAQLRKRNNTVTVEEEKIITLGPIRIDNESYEAYVEDEPLELTLKEFTLLRLLVSHPGKVFTREFLLERIWGLDCIFDTRTVDVHIHHLRQKVELDPANPQFIKTVRGIGYKAEMEAKSSQLS